MYFAPQHF